jgi:hypothetical protein
MTNLHCDKAFLNPYLLDEVRLHDDVDAKEALNKVLQKTIHTLNAYTLALRNFADFMENQGPFFDTTLMKDLDLLSHEWWDLIRVGGHTLTHIVHCILTQMCFASSFERNWSSYSFVHSKMQNQFTSNQAKDLMYIYINSKLL